MSVVSFSYLEVFVVRDIRKTMITNISNKISTERALTMTIIAYAYC